MTFTRRHIDCPKCGSKNCRFMQGIWFEHIRICAECHTKWEIHEQWEAIHRLAHQQPATEGKP